MTDVPNSSSIVPPSRMLWYVCASASAFILAVAVISSAVDYSRRYMASVQVARSELASATSYIELLVGATVAMMDSAASGIHDPDPKRLQIWLGRLISASTVAIQLSIVDDKGRFIASNISVPATPVDLSDREHIRVHMSGGNNQPFISEPVLGRVSATRTIQVSKSVVSQEGGAKFILVASLDLDRLLEELKTRVGSDPASIVIRRTSGRELISVGNPTSGCTTSEINRQRDSFGFPTCFRRSNEIVPLQISVELIRSKATMVGDWPVVALLTAGFSIATCVVLIGVAAVGTRLQTMRRQEFELRAENEVVRRTSQLYSHILHQNHAYVLVFDNAGQLAFANDRAGKELGLYIHNGRCDLAQLFGAVRGEAVESKASRRTIKLADGTYRQIAWSISKGQDGPASTIAYGIDRTAIDELNFALLHKFKLIELGSIASTLIHEMKQPMSAIELALQAVVKKARSGRDISAPLEIVHRSLERLKSLNRQSSTLGQRSVGIAADVSVKSAFADAASLLTYQFRASGTALDIDVEPDVRAFCDPNHLSQVIIIVLKNALEALGGADPAITYPRIRVQGWVSGDEVVFTVADNGPGVPDALAASIFEPYRTTKSDQGGMGLGLSIARTLMGDFLGSINLVNSPEGAMFELRLPRYPVSIPQERVSVLQ